jgi:nucleotide-binding universal stress UspA family protein
MGVTQRRRSKAVISGQPRRVLMADDGSRGAARARAFALMLAATVGARLTVTYVREPTESPEEADRKLAAMRAAVIAAGVECTAVIERPVGITNPGRRIVAAARRHHADLIVLGASGSGLVHRLLGSVSSYVVSHAPVSVSVVR